MFSSEFWEISKNTFFTGHLWASASICSKSILDILVYKKLHAVSNEKGLENPLIFSDYRFVETLWISNEVQVHMRNSYQPHLRDIFSV